MMGAEAAPAWAASPPMTKASEKEAELNARQAFAAARYDEAIELFARLYAETLNPIYLRNIGRCHQKKREADKAIDAFQDYLAKGKSITASERKEIQGYIKEMQQLRDEQAKEREAQTKQAFVPAPPATTPPATAGGTTSPATTTVNVTPAPYGNGSAYGAPAPAQGSPVLISASGGGPREANHPVYTRWWFWTAIGVVAAGAVVAALVIPGAVTKPTCPVGECK
jgi:hypothetical protein